MASSLHLPSLSIQSFRGMRSLELPELGRVTLLAGSLGYQSSFEPACSRLE